MPKAEDTIGGRDYGRRFYASDKSYAAQIRRQTDAFVNRYGKVPHSEDKKPYLEDLDYPEMEMFKFRFNDPQWPPWDPPTDPDVPGEPVDPPTTRPYWPPKPPREPFLGCFFNPPRFQPFIAAPGDTAYTQIAVASGDWIIGWEVDGPITILSNFGDVNNCRSEMRSKCHVIIRVNDDAASTPNSGIIHAFVNVQLASGQRCSAEIIIKPCTEVIPVMWDWVNSAQSVGRPGSASVFILDGLGPFKWKVTGPGFTLAHARTNERANTLIADGASCGTAKIAVEDACGNKADGEVRSVHGVWVSAGSVCLANCLGASPDPFNTVTLGGQKCTQAYGITVLTCGGGGCGGIPDACGTCENAWYSGKSCMQWCLDVAGAENCVECVKWTDNGECGWPCYCYSQCPSGAYRYLTCFRSMGLASWKWECP